MNICLVSDFFHPKLGGVEMHIYALGTTLLSKGHKVIVITHRYSDRVGIRYINKLKVYYTPFQPIYDNVALFTVLGSLPLIRNILIYEQIHIVHAHQATSYFANEVLLHAQLMGYKTIFTDHSLFAFNDMASFHVNKILKFILSDVDHAISVSHISKENLSLRASLDPKHISVIPNAVDCNRFTPDPTSRFPLNTINIVIITRLAFRKGVDLLIDVIPNICQRYKTVHFIIGGDGPKRKSLENMIERHNLQNRVEMVQYFKFIRLGGIPSNKVRDTLVRGQIFLNTSLTEAFCIAVVEAASCGLYVISTDVGGVSEVLPSDILHLAEPNPESIIKAIDEGIPKSHFNQYYKIHQRVSQMYSWNHVADRVEKVYENVLKQPNKSIVDKLKAATSNGPFYSIYIIIILIIDYLFILLLDIIAPIRQFAIKLK
ncbi:hypothetical protein pb186bvf_013518 [Paramecium bursaria]